MTAFVAPYAGGRKVRLQLSDGLSWDCPVEGRPEPGWGVFRLTAQRTAEQVRLAWPWEWEDRPLRTLVLLGADGRGRTWGCAPGRTPGPPVALALADGEEPFAQLSCWFDRTTWWAAGPSPRTDAGRSSLLREALGRGLRPEALEGLDRPGDREIYRRAWSLAHPPSADPGERLQRALALAEADLVDWQDRPGGYRVRWRRHGRDFTTHVGPDLAVQEAGFCLSGTDRAHDLTSLASLLDEAPWRH